MILPENVELPFSNRDVLEYSKYIYDESYDNERLDHKSNSIISFVPLS